MSNVLVPSGSGPRSQITVYAIAASLARGGRIGAAGGGASDLGVLLRVWDGSADGQPGFDRRGQLLRLGATGQLGDDLVERALHRHPMVAEIDVGERPRGG